MAASNSERAALVAGSPPPPPSPAPPAAWRATAAGAALAGFTAAQSLLVELSKRDHGGRVPFHMPSAVFYTDALKFTLASLAWLWQCRTREHSGLERFTFLRSTAYALPAAIFIAQNLLQFYAMARLAPPDFQLWSSFKLLPTGLLHYVVLGRRRTRVQWVALVLLAAGLATTTLQANGGDIDDGSVLVPRRRVSRYFQGVALLVVNGCLSAASGTINEWLIKFQDPNAPLMFTNMQLYAYGTMVSSWGLRPGAGDWDALSLTIIVVNALTGLSISLVLKLTDNVTKSFASSASVILAAVASTACCGYELTNAFGIGTLVVGCAFHLFFSSENARIERDAAREAEEVRARAEAEAEESTDPA